MKDDIEDMKKTIEDIMYELRTLNGIIFLTFFLNVIAYIVLFGYFIIAHT